MAERTDETVEFARTVLHSLLAAIRDVPAARFEAAVAELDNDPAYDDALLAAFMRDVARWKRMAEEAGNV